IHLSQHIYLHSFPTRRSSDLGDHAQVGDLFAVLDQGLWLVDRLRGQRNAVRGTEFDMFGQERPRGDIDFTGAGGDRDIALRAATDRKSTRLNSSHVKISYAVF